MILLLNTFWVDRWVGGVGSFVSLTGSWAGAFVAALLLALAFFVAKRAPLGALVLLLVFGGRLAVRKLVNDLKTSRGSLRLA